MHDLEHLEVDTDTEQGRATLIYTLGAENFGGEAGPHTGFCIRACLYGQGREEEAAVLDVTGDERRAKKLLMLLADGQAMPVTLSEIIEDFLATEGDL